MRRQGGTKKLWLTSTKFSWRHGRCSSTMNEWTCASKGQTLLELEIKHKHGGFNINYEKATVVWQ
jgi:hypothetical protein